METMIVQYPIGFSKTNNTTILMRANTNVYGNYGVVSNMLSFVAINFNNAQGLNTSWFACGY